MICIFVQVMYLSLNKYPCVRIQEQNGKCEKKSKSPSKQDQKFTNDLVHMRTCRLKNTNSNIYIHCESTVPKPNRFQFHEIELVCYLPTLMHFHSILQHCHIHMLNSVFAPHFSGDTMCRTYSYARTVNNSKQLVWKNIVIALWTKSMWYFISDIYKSDMCKLSIGFGYMEVYRHTLFAQCVHIRLQYLFIESVLVHNRRVRMCSIIIIQSPHYMASENHITL